MDKKELTPEQVYNRNKKIVKWLRILAPVVFWACLALSVFCIFFAVKNSFGNIVEICTLLETSNYTGEQLRDNYSYLIDKYGEWVIGTGGAGFTISFVNIGKALFSGIMITNLVLAGILFACAFVLGRYLMPMIATQIENNMQDAVNRIALKGAGEK